MTSKNKEQPKHTTTPGMDFTKASVNADGVVSAALAAATRECRHPQQSRVQAHESFECYGLN